MRGEGPRHDWEMGHGFGDSSGDDGEELRDNSGDERMIWKMSWGMAWEWGEEPRDNSEDGDMSWRTARGMRGEAFVYSAVHPSSAKHR